MGHWAGGELSATPGTPLLVHIKMAPQNFAKRCMYAYVCSSRRSFGERKKKIRLMICLLRRIRRICGLQRRERDRELVFPPADKGGRRVGNLGELYKTRDESSCSELNNCFCYCLARIHTSPLSLSLPLSPYS